MQDPNSQQSSHAVVEILSGGFSMSEEEARIRDAFKLLSHPPIITEETMKKRVAILTNFTSADSAYSLNIVVQDQIKMLVRAGYKPTVIVGKGFIPKEAYLLAEIKEIPNVPCHNEVKVDETFDADVQGITDSLREILKDIDIVLTHDVVYQPAALKHNLAARKIADEYPKIRWLHWIHSATSPYTLIGLRQFFTDQFIQQMSVPFPNSFYVFFNDYSKPRISANFNVPTSMVRTVYHPIDVAGYFNFSEISSGMTDRWQLLDCDFLAVYPIRLDRGKQVQYVIKTMAAMRAFGRTAKVVIVDFHSTAGDKVPYRDSLRELAKEYEVEVYFTSDYSEETKYEVPRSVVKDLFSISNVYIHPSVSESYSLSVQEAAALGNIVVLNEDFPPMRDIYGEEPLYRKYSSNINSTTGLDGETQTKYTDEDFYHRETAELILKRYLNSPELKLRKKILRTRNLDYIFKNQLEVLFG